MIEQNSEESTGIALTDGVLETPVYSCDGSASDNPNYEVHVIGQYESSNGIHGIGRPRVAGDTDVNLQVTGENRRPLILVLASYEPVNWQLSVTAGVTIDRVIAVSFNAMALEGHCAEFNAYGYNYRYIYI